MRSTYSVKVTSFEHDIIGHSFPIDHVQFAGIIIEPSSPR